MPQFYFSHYAWKKDIMHEAWHHPGKLTPTYREHNQWANTARLAVMAECRVSVSFLPPSDFLAMAFPLSHFCSLLQPWIFCSQIHSQLSPISTLCVRELVLQAESPCLPVRCSQWERAVVGKRGEGNSQGISSPLFSPGFSYHERPTRVLASVFTRPTTLLPHFAPRACRQPQFPVV